MSTYMHGIIFCIILGVASATKSETIVVQEGDSLFLQCKGEKGNHCVWIRIYSSTSGEIIAGSNTASTSSRYHLTDSPESGDCSLNITDMKTDDNASFWCTINPNPTLIRYNVFIGVEPRDPHIEYNNQNVNDGDLVIIETPAEIKCVVEGGSPGAIVFWENEDNDAGDVTRVVNGKLIDVINTLKIESLLNENKSDNRITCVAHHPLYPNKRTITVTVGEKSTDGTNKISYFTSALCILTALNLIRQVSMLTVF